MNNERRGYSPETELLKIHPLIKDYLQVHSDLSRREQEFLINYYQNLRQDMGHGLAGAFRKEAGRIKGEGKTGEAFKKAWGTATQNPENGPNTTTIFMAERENIKEAAAHQAIELFELKQEAEIDHISGLYRGGAFDRYAEETLAAAQKLAQEYNKELPEQDKLVSAYVAFDVDNFKTINEIIGHDRADTEILAKMGEIIKGTPEKPGLIRSTDLASRIGGDEFVILFTHIKASEVEKTIQRLLTAFGTITYETPDGPQKLSVSAGVKIIKAEEKTSLKSARHMADEAGNLAKIEKNTFLIYTTDLPDKIEAMIVEGAKKSDADNKGLQFYLRQLRQLNKRTIEDTAKFNETGLAEFEKTLERQAHIKLATKLKELKTKEKAA
ncbi:MAG: Diguanylate cyclase [Candidatus Magasanikbacteria bacterium GW2011_GWC2_40_17]|uniref:Diguanylate cyclase n=1 Tax=Candidatus Magasanikbacteria bacterium GW2011_GWA2_42_32 TaxID=1619039 RepID=A0A0G1D4W2_9BACT|nr:MAG: Diguanylate cyclase [Candidatus Magasanikbacteria bacterium GW2011_GWC2_40_17]KKS57068.1 MAG: Diguanylate cyclase [Candidatus Magasanikbacteria bacterium GW2011_GWA2_42_32]OGH85405.1 MAG: hypothetical protein A2294_01430 [Candidatus Magasanikbacteria bacterium RIFOXYB2_FULL_38_10]